MFQISQFKQRGKAVFIVTACLLTSLLPVPAHAQPDIEHLEQRLIEFSAALYSDSVTLNTATSMDSIQDLYTGVKQFVDAGDVFSALQLLSANLGIVEQQLDFTPTLFFLQLSLKHNAWQIAQRLLDSISIGGTPLLYAQAQYLLAQYYFQRQQWQTVADVLRDVTTRLSEDKADGAHLMLGIALQWLKQHRRAMEHYQQVAADSPLYSYAQLNIAIAYIRQGWWTDAHLMIRRLLADPKIVKSGDFDNRLHLIMGYSLLEQDHYREARVAFQNVQLDSMYTQRALLGIGLTAIYQDDYPHALNAFLRLQQLKPMDLAVEEAYLLLPYLHIRLKKQATAAAHYSESINYYQQRINAITATLDDPQQFAALTQQPVLEHSVSPNIMLTVRQVIDDTVIESQVPAAFLQNLQTLNSMATQAISPELQAELDNLRDAYQTAHQRFIVAALEQRIAFLNSYMNQARYGLARLYDNNYAQQP